MDGEAIPERKPIELHQINQDYEDGVWALIGGDVSKLSSKTVRVNITMPSRVLSIIDEAAARERESRSGLLTRAALQFVDRQPHSFLGRNFVCNWYRQEQPGARSLRPVTC